MTVDRFSRTQVIESMRLKQRRSLYVNYSRILISFRNFFHYVQYLLIRWLNRVFSKLRTSVHKITLYAYYLHDYLLRPNEVTHDYNPFKLFYSGI